jgi:hypothetical protein
MEDQAIALAACVSCSRRNLALRDLGLRSRAVIVDQLSAAPVRSRRHRDAGRAGYRVDVRAKVTVATLRPAGEGYTS